MIMNSLQGLGSASRCKDSCRANPSSSSVFGSGDSFPPEQPSHYLAGLPEIKEAPDGALWPQFGRTAEKSGVSSYGSEARTHFSIRTPKSDSPDLQPCTPAAGNADEPPPSDRVKFTQGGEGMVGAAARQVLTFCTRLRTLLIVMVMLSSVAVANWAHLYRALEIASAGLDQTQSELLRANSENEAGQKRMRRFEQETRIRFEVLRNEIAERLALENKRHRLREKELVEALSSKVANAQLEQGSFKRIFSAARDSILFIRTEYQVQFLKTGETKTFTSFGTGFFISPVGEAMTANHVLYPWLYNREIKAMEELGVVKVLEDTLELTMWLTDSQVMGEKRDPASYYEKNGYRLGGERRDIRILYTADLEQRPEQVMSPLGPVEIEMPELGKGDFVIFQIMDFSRRFNFVQLDPSGHNTSALDEVMAIGYPLARLQDGKAIPQVTRGVVRRMGQSIMELDSPLHSGNSGGPILDKRGRVVGLASAVLDSPVYGVAVRGEDLNAAWKQVRETVGMDQRRLKEIGCYSGAVDGIPGQQTLQARQCRERQVAVAY